MTAFEVFAVAGLGEVAEGVDVAALLVEHVTLLDGDVVVVTSKVVSKAEGRVVTATKSDALAAETDRVVAQRGQTSIVRTRHGLVMAGAGIDASNTPPGTLVLLPEDPDGSARRLRTRIGELTGRCVAVVVSDTSGRAWRNGQTDIAIGAAGLRVLDDHAGRTDGYGNVLAVTAPALGDELAAAGDLAKRKLGRTPVAVVRGLGDLVLAPEDDGPGAAALVRDENHDMFGVGAREAVMQALGGGDPVGFGAPATSETLLAALSFVADGCSAEVSAGGSTAIGEAAEVTVRVDEQDPGARARLEARLEVAAHAHGWRGGRATRPAQDDRRLRFRPVRPVPTGASVDSPMIPNGRGEN